MGIPVSKHKFTRLCIIICLALPGPLFILLTDPNSLPLPLLILPFVWLFICIYLLSKLILTVKSRANDHQVRIVAICLAAIPVLLLVFQSIHQLSVRDVLLSFAIMTLVAIYTLRADFIK